MIHFMIHHGPEAQISTGSPTRELNGSGGAVRDWAELNIVSDLPDNFKFVKYPIKFIYLRMTKFEICRKADLLKDKLF